MNPFFEVSQPFDWLQESVSIVSHHMEQDAGHDWGHLTRVLKHAYDISETLHVDVEVVTAAVLFHDVINVPKDSNERHLASQKSADFAVEYFPFFSEEQRRKLHDAILCHSFSAAKDPQTDEGRVVQDADNLESLGALGIARTFYICGRLDSELFSASDPFAEHRELDDRRYGVDHFYRKILKLPATMKTERGRELADEYTKVIEAFLDRLRVELLSI